MLMLMLVLASLVRTGLDTRPARAGLINPTGLCGFTNRHGGLSVSVNIFIQASTFAASQNINCCKNERLGGGSG